MINSNIPKISVIIPCYNVGEYLAGCLNSVLNQSLVEIEIICIDDGSQDNTLEMLQDYAARDARIIVKTQSNQGASTARNVGLSICTGLYVYFLDSDDSIREDALEMLYNQAVNTNSQIVTFEFEVQYANEHMEREFAHRQAVKQRMGKYEGVFSGGELFTLMNENNDYRVSLCLHLFESRHLKENNIIFQDIVRYEDRLFTFQSLLLCQRITYLPEPLHYRLLRPDSITTSPHREYNLYIGSFTYIVETLKFIVANRTKISDQTIVAAQKEIVTRYNHSLRFYKKLSAKQKHKIDFENPTSQLISELLYRRFADSKATKTKALLEEELEKSKRELICMKNSMAFKIGRFITYVPRKIRTILQRFK